jgi:hypothetical protein
MKPDALNLLYHASLEFGENFRRPLKEWSGELFPEMGAKERAEISAYIETVRSEIEDYVAEQYPLQTTQESVLRWIHERYPWMDQDNAMRGFSQGMYFAWHG